MKYEREPFDVLCKLSQLKKCIKDDIEIAVFRDNGWGDDPNSHSIYTIILDGNGQIDYGEVSEECFRLLLKDGYIEHNTLQTYKDRGYHKYIGPIDIEYSGWQYAPYAERLADEAGGKG